MTLVQLIGWSAALLILQVVLQAATGVLELGLPYAVTARDEGRRPNSRLANRLDRALANLLETYPAFVALALALLFTGKTGGTGLLGAQLWLLARAVYVAIYALGVSYVRTLVWAASIAGLLMMLAALLG
jgi:uncharacterized MAPEG superfamily protein